MALPSNATGWMANGTGGVNYYVNGAPATNTQFAQVTGANTGYIEGGQFSSSQNGISGGTYFTPNGSGGANYYDSGGNPISSAQYQGLGGGTAPASTPITNVNNAAPAEPAVDPAVVNAILGEIAGLGGGLSQSKSNNQKSYNSTLGNYNADAVAQTAKKDASLNTNDLSYLVSQQESLVNSAKLRQSLLSTLIGMGALNGSGVGQANSTIGGALQTDLTGANSNYGTNANNILTAMDSYTRQNEARKKSLKQTLTNANTAADNSFYVNKQDYLKQLAGLYPTGSTQGADFLRQAMSLGPQIQATSNVPQYDFTPITSASFNAPDLAKYLAGTNQLSVGGQDPNAGVGTFSTINKKRTDLTAPLALTTGN